MAFLINKSQTQTTSASSADVVEFGKNKFELEQFILRNLNNALNINDESSYLNSFDIKVARLLYGWPTRHHRILRWQAMILAFFTSQISRFPIL